MGRTQKILDQGTDLIVHGGGDSNLFRWGGKAPLWGMVPPPCLAALIISNVPLNPDNNKNGPYPLSSLKKGPTSSGWFWHLPLQAEVIYSSEKLFCDIWPLKSVCSCRAWRNQSETSSWFLPAPGHCFLPDPWLVQAPDTRLALPEVGDAQEPDFWVWWLLGEKLVRFIGQLNF